MDCCSFYVPHPNSFFPPDFEKHIHFDLGMVLVLVTFLSRQLVEGRVYLVLCCQREESIMVEQ